MKELMHMICDELKDIEGKGMLSAGDLDAVYKLIVAKEKLLRIEEIEGDMGYSGDEGNYNAHRAYARDGGYSGRRSYSNGSYSRRGRSYSMAEGKDKLIHAIEGMMDELDPKDRQILDNALDKMR